MTLTAVPPEQTPAVLQTVMPQVQRALRSGQGDGTTLEAFLHGLTEGDMTMWAVHDDERVKATLVLSIPVSPTGRKVFVELLAGKDMDSWVDELESALQDYRDVIGATCIEASCRPGLAERLARRGWKRKAIIMEAP